MNKLKPIAREERQVRISQAMRDSLSGNAKTGRFKGRKTSSRQAFGRNPDSSAKNEDKQRTEHPKVSVIGDSQ